MKALFAIGYLIAHLHLPVHREPTCQAAYLDLYRKDLIDVQMVFGYKDTRPTRFVGDRYERAVFIQRILQMGFNRDPKDENGFIFDLSGPDGRKKTIHLEVVASSVSPDDETNRKDPYQKWHTTFALKHFEDALTSADVVFYNGHSRDGGGPDFAPPEITPGSHVDYEKYRRRQPGYRRMISALRKTKPGPKLLGLFSCASDQHFAKGIRGASPRTALIASGRLLYYADALDASIETLRDLIQMKCGPDFHPAGTELTGFFERY